MKNVLIMEPGGETADDLCFLLRLAGHRPTWARSGAEAINWVVCRRDLGQDFDLLLISRACRFLSLSRLVGEIRGAGAQIPILILERESIAPPSHPGVFLCSPSEGIAVAESLLQSPPEAFFEHSPSH